MAGTNGSTTQAPPAKRTQPERRASSERRLLDATAQLIAERGTSKVSFVDIARTAGCSHGLPGYLFGSKTNLLLALVDDALDLFRKSIEPLLPTAASPAPADGLEVLMKVMETFLCSLADPWKHTRALYVLFGEAQGAPQELRAALAAHHEAVRSLIGGLLSTARDQGDIRPDVNVEAQAATLVGTLRGIGQQVLIDPDALDVPLITAEVLESTRRVLRS